MLVICNGAFKSGSTWLFNIINEMYDFSQIPERYLTGNNRLQPCIHPDKHRDFLEDIDYIKKSYISKNHLGKKEHRRLLLSYPNVFVLDIERDIRDVVVSAYYHACHRHGYEDDFRTFYWNEGRKVASDVIDYHKLWSNNHSNIYVSSYQQLQHAFQAEVRRIGVFLGVMLSDEDIVRIQEKTTMENLRKRYAEEPSYRDGRNAFFFRKGIIGDWKDHLDEEMLKDIDCIKRRGMNSFNKKEIFVFIKDKARSLKTRLTNMCT